MNISWKQWEYATSLTKYWQKVGRKISQWYKYQEGDQRGWEESLKRTLHWTTMSWSLNTKNVQEQIENKWFRFTRSCSLLTVKPCRFFFNRIVWKAVKERGIKWNGELLGAQIPTWHQSFILLFHNFVFWPPMTVNLEDGEIFIMIIRHRFVPQYF